MPVEMEMSDTSVERAVNVIEAFYSSSFPKQKETEALSMNKSSLTS